jgi:hypothetical protein
MTLPAGDLRRASLRTLGWMLLGLTVLFTAETAVELLRTGTPWSSLRTTPATASALTTTVSRSLNALLAMVLGFVSIAIPITANMYTPRLVEIFVSDRVNLAGLVFFATAGAHALFAQWQTFEQWTPLTHVHLVWVSGVVAFAVVVPYYLYVLEFLNPTTIIHHVRARVVAAFPERHHGPAQRAFLHDRILQLGNVVLRAVDRADRDVAIASVAALESAVLEYLAWKPRAPAPWYEVERELFPGLATEAIVVLRRERTWVEHTCLHQLRVAYLAALARMPDAVGAISAVTRRVAVAGLLAGDDAVTDLSIRFFNTFLRQALARKDSQAVHDVLRQYRALAIELLTARPRRARDIARHMRYYAALARLQGLPFVHDLAASDVALVVEAAYECASPAAAGILEEFREFRGESSSLRMVKTLAAVASWLTSHGHHQEGCAVAADLRRSTKGELEAALRDVAAATDPVFWEVTDRQTNLDYVPPDRRPHVLALLEDAIERLRGPAV